MKRTIAVVFFSALILTMAACSSSTPSDSGEPKKMEGKRIPPGAGPGRGGAAPEKN